MEEPNFIKPQANAEVQELAEDNEVETLYSVLQ